MNELKKRLSEIDLQISESQNRLNLIRLRQAELTTMINNIINE